MTTSKSKSTENPLEAAEEVQPRTLDVLFALPPSQLTLDDRKAIVARLLEEREKVIAEEADAKKAGRKPKPVGRTVNLDDLDLDSMVGS